MNTIELVRRAGAAAIAAAALAAPAASAAGKPVPCNGKLLATDPAGDAFVGFIGLAESPVPAGPNTDFTGLFINNFAGKHTVNYSIADLSTTVPPDATSIGYRINYEIGDVTNYLQVSIASAGTVTYSYGHSETGGLARTATRPVPCSRARTASSRSSSPPRTRARWPASTCSPPTSAGP